MEPSQLIAKYRGKGVLLDTNLMLLLAVGLYKRERISSFKRTDQYTARDFSLVADIISKFDRRITTPHILAETDNLTRQLPVANITQSPPSRRRSSKTSSKFTHHPPPRCATKDIRIWA